MNEKINSDLKSLKLIFNRNKSYIFSGVMILVSIMLFFQFVIPQFNVLLVARKEAEESLLKLKALKENLSILVNVNEEFLDPQLKTLNLALPLNKDFVGILNSVYSTAQKTGVGLGSFSIVVGDLAQPEDNNNFPVIKLSTPIDASVTAVNSFIGIISKTVPLSEVYFVKAGSISSSVSLSFYYKPLSASNYDRDARISPISQKGLTLIRQLNEFENMSSSWNLSIPVATSSAVQ